MSDPKPKCGDCGEELEYIGDSDDLACPYCDADAFEEEDEDE